MIPEYADDLDFENRLPPGQAPIMTTSVQRFHAYMHLLMQSRAETGYATMGVITGDAGVGKTIAVQTYVQSLTPRAYSGFPACVSIKVSPPVPLPKPWARRCSPRSVDSPPVTMSMIWRMPQPKPSGAATWISSWSMKAIGSM